MITPGKHDMATIERGSTPRCTPSAAAFSNENGNDLIWGLDENGSAEGLYPSNGTPHSLVINRDRTIIAIFEGSSSDTYPCFESADVDADT